MNFIRHSRRLRLFLALGTILVVALGAGIAYAYFTATVASGSNGGSTSGSLSQGNKPTANASGSSVTVSWTENTVGGQLLSSYSNGGYKITRYPSGGGTGVAVCGGTVSASTCTDNSVPGGTWAYTVTPVLNNWSGTASPQSATVTTTTITLAAPSDGSATNNNKPTFSGLTTGTSTVTVNVYGGSSATGTALQTLTTSPSSGSWSVAPTTALTDGTYTAQATEDSAMSGTSTFVVDTSAPSGGALRVNGTLATNAGSTSTNSSGSFPIGTRTDYTDSGSGLGSSVLTVQKGTITSSNGIASPSCTSFGTPTTITGSPSQSALSTSCYLYKLTGTDRAGNTSSVSTTVEVDTTAPSTPSITPSAASGNTFISGTTIFINAQAGKSGGFTATATSTDTDSGIASIAFPSLTGFTSGGGTVNSSPFATTYAWTGAVGATGAQTVTATNGVGLTKSSTFTVTPDTTAPSGGALTVNGAAAASGGSTSTNTSGSFAISTRTDYTDAGSGLATSLLTVQQGTLSSSNGIAAPTCTAFGAPTTILSSPSQSGLATGCYLYTLTGIDHVGNSASISTTVEVDATAPSAPSLTLSAASGNTFISGTTVFINPQAGDSGGFTAAATSADNDSGIASIAFPTLTGFTSGGGSISSSPFTTTYAWSGAVSASGTQTVTATNGAGGTKTSSFIVTPDTTAPSGGAITYSTSGQGATVSFTFTSGADSGSGVSSSTTALQKSLGTFNSTTSTCSNLGTFSTIAIAPTNSTTDTLKKGDCAKYQYVVPDNVGNTTIYTSSTVVSKS